MHSVARSQVIAEREQYYSLEISEIDLSTIYQQSILELISESKSVINTGLIMILDRKIDLSEINLWEKRKDLCLGSKQRLVSEIDTEIGLWISDIYI